MGSICSKNKDSTVEGARAKSIINEKKLIEHEGVLNNDNEARQAAFDWCAIKENKGWTGTGNYKIGGENPDFIYYFEVEKVKNGVKSVATESDRGSVSNCSVRNSNA